MAPGGTGPPAVRIGGEDSRGSRGSLGDTRSKRARKEASTSAGLGGGSGSRGATAAAAAVGSNMSPTGDARSQKHIASFFGAGSVPRAVSPARPAAAAGKSPGGVAARPAMAAAVAPTAQAEPAAPQVLARTKELEERVRELEGALLARDRELDNLRGKIEKSGEDRDEERKQGAAALERLMRDVIRDDILARRRRLVEDQFKLGSIGTQRTGYGGAVEVWEDGHEMKQVSSEQTKLLARREELERRKKAVQKLARSRKASSNATSGGDGDGSGAGAGTEAMLSQLEIVEEDENIKVQLAALKREEATLAERRRSLENQKALLLREIKRVRDEDNSRFSPRPVLNNRYQLIKLLGKGGFSEVWHALDLLDVREVAVKVHQLATSWSDAKKQNYIKHVTREYSIHKVLSHPRVVHLYDVFDIDMNSFATVLEYCRGPDLDFLLKERSTFPEREARVILMHVLFALQYLHSGKATAGGRPLRVIHYDLKPGNILFDEDGNAKVTDFGLSKVMPEESDMAATSMELTSQGAGTYWYLPPECFMEAGVGPRISAKVDVWSLGVIYYEMLFGKRPFGHGQSQDKVLRDKVILLAKKVEFPAKPAISAEAKAFIELCLCPEQSARPTVDVLCEHPYLKTKLKG